MRYFICALFFVVSAAHAQNTTALPEGAASPKATLNDISWMQGHWSGEAFGGITEEIWGPPSGGSMMFSFKLVSDGQVGFYELGHIRELDNTLVYELKHFHGDLKGWEEKDEVQSFKLVKVDGKRVYFEGFTFEKVSNDEINIYAQIGDEDGSAEEVTFNFKKE
ncbi:DUF6265 family protein [Zobellia galactanivorans]|uniref:DUF6265 family protein n=1 Tax=Zobellia galactanivorans (strain DSM 12802 / CCUG 47099 / CIP 106680 / NCIMB 13871 / Dsij) TaxID=63186 RepID=UPI001C0756A7|nr:DUF6265 family protein [Zobellia galactanivorans]MBU3026449.1 hypothetical protein [Zobellia galactanivorans]MDO6810014.1 DUF6265 family protein [Zobellia galactanivorans]